MRLNNEQTGIPGVWNGLKHLVQLLWTQSCEMKSFKFKSRPCENKKESFWFENSDGELLKIF